IPQAERDGLEIYPGDYRRALIPQPEQSNWNWRKFEEWHEQGIKLVPVGAQVQRGIDALHLRDYSEPVRLRNKSGSYRFEDRQKAASPVSLILVRTNADWYLAQLTPPTEQRTLERIGRHYKNSCWGDGRPPQLGKARLFDRAGLR